MNQLLLKLVPVTLGQVDMAVGVIADEMSLGSCQVLYKIFKYRDKRCGKAVNAALQLLVFNDHKTLTFIPLIFPAFPVSRNDTVFPS